MTLNDATVEQEYIVKDILADDEEMREFLFTLGCYSGEPVTVVSKKKHSLVLAIKDSKYNIDSELADAILI